MLYYNDENIKLKKGTVVTIGKFDGFHIGHMKLIENVMALKESNNLQSVIFSFRPHPQEVLGGEIFRLIFTTKEKIKIMENWDMDVFIQYPFTESFINLEPEEFIKQILIEKLNCKYVVVGESYRFGKQQKGDIETLKRFEDKYGYKTITVPYYTLADMAENEKVSSSLIRDEIYNGEIETANKMLGRTYFVEEEVLHGNEIGRTIGFPTINMVPNKRKLLPKNGVYITKVMIDENEYIGVTNIGKNPTVGNCQIKAETNILNFSGDLYGKTLKVLFFKRLRDEVKYENLEQLKKQITVDCENAVDFFKGCINISHM